MSILYRTDGTFYAAANATYIPAKRDPAYENDRGILGQHMRDFTDDNSVILLHRAWCAHSEAIRKVVISGSKRSRRSKFTRRISMAYREPNYFAMLRCKSALRAELYVVTREQHEPLIGLSPSRGDGH